MELQHSQTNLRGDACHGIERIARYTPGGFQSKDHGLQQLRADSYRGLIFATFGDRAPLLYDYLGPTMRPGLDRIIFHKPIVYLGCVRQYSRNRTGSFTTKTSGILPSFLCRITFASTFNVVPRRNAARGDLLLDDGLHSWSMIYHTEDAAVANLQGQRLFVVQGGPQARRPLDSGEREGI